MNISYQLLIVEEFNKQIISNKMNNPCGFTDTRLLKIVNSLDNSVIELVENKLFAKADDPARESFQTFKCNSSDGGFYEIQSNYQIDEADALVWDYLSHLNLLTQKKKNRKARQSNQNWITEAVPGSVSSYFIISAPNCKKCLINMGVDQQIKVVPKTDQIIGDKAAHWKLIMLEPLADNNIARSLQITSTQSQSSGPSVRSPSKKSNCVLL